MVDVAFSKRLWSGNLSGIKWDFSSSPVWGIRHSGMAGGALQGGSGDSPSLLATLFQEEWEVVMSKSSCWNRRAIHHCPAWTQQCWPGRWGNEGSTVFICCLHAQKSSSMWCIHIYEYNLYVPGLWTHPFLTATWCLAALARGTRVWSWRQLWEASAGLTLLFKAAFWLWLTHHTPLQPWSLLSQAPPRPQPRSIPSQGLPSRPGPGPAVTVGDGWAIANPGHCPQPGPACLAGGCGKGLFSEGGNCTALAAPWPQPCPCSPTSPVEPGWRCRSWFFVAALSDIWAILEARRGFC